MDRIRHDVPAPRVDVERGGADGLALLPGGLESDGAGRVAVRELQPSCLDELPSP